MGQVGYGQACIVVLETAGKGKSLGLLGRAIVYHAYLGAGFCVWILSACMEAPVR
jgi:hypothetical protein